MRRNAPILAAVALAAVAIVVGFAVKISVWNECRQSNSALYCWSIVTR